MTNLTNGCAKTVSIKKQKTDSLVYHGKIYTFKYLYENKNKKSTIIQQNWFKPIHIKKDGFPMVVL